MNNQQKKEFKQQLTKRYGKRNFSLYRDGTASVFTKTPSGEYAWQFVGPVAALPR